MVLVVAHPPCDVGGISVDTSLEKTNPEKVWKHKHLKAA